MLIQPYLYFDGRCEEAFQFYAVTIGAQIGDMMRYKDMPSDQPVPPDAKPEPDKILYATLHVGGTTVMASDECGASKPFSSFALGLTLDSEAEVERVFAALAEGGRVTMPLGKTFFSDKFGMLVDRFGVAWMVLAGHG